MIQIGTFTMPYIKHRRLVFNIALVSLIAFLSAFLQINRLLAQKLDDVVRRTPVETPCGSIIEGEFTVNYEAHYYNINLSAGDIVDLSLVPIGNQLQTRVSFYSPTEIYILSDPEEPSNHFNPTQITQQPAVNPGVLSANGLYIIEVTNYRYTGAGESLGQSGGTGVYTLYIGCTLRDGTVIEPGSTAPPPDASGSESGNAPAPVPAFSGFGFPGLPPVDFAQGVTINTELGTTNSGAITPGFAGIFGFAFSADAGREVNLVFERTSGNMNLAVIVLSEQNEVIFASALTSTTRLTANFVIPTAGTYTVGIAEANLMAPAAPEATSFSLSLE